MDEKVTVIIPTYYSNNSLQHSLESVHRQKYDNIEIIVVDDSGEGNAENIIEEHDVTYIKKDKNEGPAAAREIGIKQSNGSYICLLDDDDELMPNSILKRVECIQSDEAVGVVYSGLKLHDGTIVLPSKDIRGDVLKHALMLQMAPCLPSTMLIEYEVMKNALPISTLPHGGDAAMKIELAKITSFGYVNKPLTKRVIREDSLGASPSTVDERRNLISFYDDLYNDFPDKVRNTALARTYLQEAKAEVYTKGWSIQSIKAASLSCYYFPGFHLPAIGALIASLLGRPGWDLGFKIYTHYIIGGTRYGNIGEFSE